jgi:hypothetical protein
MTVINTLLTPEDSKAVADALIDKIAAADFDVATAVRDLLIPQANLWRADWFPLIVEDTCNKIARGIVNAAEQARRKG